MTERETLAKFLRGAAAYHRRAASLVVVSWEFLREMRSLGVCLDFPPAGDPGELTPDQAERYAGQLEGAGHG